MFRLSLCCPKIFINNTSEDLNFPVMAHPPIKGHLDLSIDYS